MVGSFCSSFLATRHRRRGEERRGEERRGRAAKEGGRGACGSEFCVKFVKRLIPDPSFSRQQRCGVYHASCGVLSIFSIFLPDARCALTSACTAPDLRLKCFWSACDLRCTRTAGAASAVPLAFMPFDMLQTTCILTTCGCSGMLAMYRRRDDQRESLDWQSRGQAFGARALNPIECGPLPANVSFLSVLDDKTSQMLFVLWRQVALVKGHFFERTASCEEASELTPVEMYSTIIIE